MKRNLFLSICIILLAYGTFSFLKQANLLAPAAAEEGTQTQHAGTQIKAPSFDFQEYTIKEGDTFATALDSIGVGYGAMSEILTSAEDVYDFTSIRLGKTLRYVMQEEGLSRLEYDIDNETIAVVKKIPGGFETVTSSIQYDAKEIVKGATIESSLFVAGGGVGMSDRTILNMAEIFAWNIDFATQIQKGDSFNALYQARTRNGEEAPDGPILAADFTTGGATYTAFRFEAPDGSVKYYDAEGNALVRQFLRAPLRYNRITSGYTNSRFHPTLGKNTEHRAIDYAAPIGTPVYSVGDGTIRMAGWNGGYGIMVKVRHNDTYTTNYAHLTRVAKGIRIGARVTQGQVIGYVGSTGFSTGPHLHYEIQKNGFKVNPLRLELPKGDPIKDEWRTQFEQVRDQLKQRLNV